MIEFTPVLIVLIVFSFITISSIGPSYLKSRERLRMIELVRSATDKGEPIPPEVLSTLVAEPKPRKPFYVRDIRIGVILLSVALAFELFAICIYLAGYAAAHLSSNDPSDMVPPTIAAIVVAGVGAIPACVGAAFLALGINSRKTAEA